MSLTPGRKFGSYEIVSLLGSGGMGRVYRARDTRLDRDVALKVLHEDIVPTPSTLHRFEREARSASNLNHPNIVTIYEIGEEDGTRFIAMEYVEGSRLRDLIRRGELSVRKIAEIAAGIAAGLAAAHERSIIHRDLKPENVLVTERGLVKLLDFGLAKAVVADEALSPDQETMRMPSHETVPGAVVGTPNYMAPEQVRGEPAGAQADQFALGTILFEMLSGSRPFDRPTTAETMTAILKDDPPELELGPEVPAELVEAMERCLRKDSAERYASTDDLASLIRDVATRESLPGTPVSSEIAVRATRRPFPWRNAVAALLAAMALAWIFVQRNDTASPLTGNGTSLEAASLPEEKYLAVQPFEDLGGGDESWELFARGMSDTVSARLMDVASLQVIPPATTAQVGSDRHLLATELGANLVLNAGLRRSGDQIRVNYAIVDTGSGSQLAAGVVNGTTSDPFRLEDRLADSILHSLELRLARNGVGMTNQGLLAPGSQDQYLVALGALQRYDDPESVEKGLEILTRLREESPGSALIAASLARAWLYTFGLEKSPESAQRAIALAEEAIRLNPDLPEAHIVLGEALAAMSRFEDARLRFETALELRPSSAPATLGLAEALDRAGREPEALEAYEKAIELQPYYWGGYNKLAVFHLRRGRLDQARPWLEKVVELTPDTLRGRNNLGAIYVMEGEFEKAAEMFRESVAIRPNKGGYSNLGTALYYLGRYDEAADAFARATDLAPDDYLLWLNRGDAERWGRAGRAASAVSYGKAEALAVRAAEERSEDAWAHMAIGYARAKLGEPGGSAHVERALSLGGEETELLRFAAIAFASVGEQRRAAELKQRFLDAGGEPELLERDPGYRSNAI